MHSLELKCECGDVVGKLQLTAKQDFSRLVCCCTDCQSFARKSKRSEALDEYGGTDILQVAPNMIEINKGADLLVCNRLSKKGLHRWTTQCCNTLVGNSVSLKIPFFAIIHSFIENGHDELDKLTPISAYLYTRDALKPVEFKPAYDKVSPLFMTRAILSILRRKIKGAGSPTPFYAENGHAITKPQLITD